MISYATKGGVMPSARGRCSNQGRVIHAIPGTPANGFWGTAALCGTKPGYRGFGWLESSDTAATCPKCVKALVKVS